MKLLNNGLIKKEEKFLKELGYNETWYPWKRSAIVIKGENSAFWEKFAVFVSAIALLFSAAATLATQKQAELMQEQIAQGDRNSAITRAVESLFEYCSSMDDLPVYQTNLPYRMIDGREVYAKSYRFFDIDSLSEETDMKFRKGVAQKRFKAQQSILALAMWLKPSEDQIYVETMLNLDELYKPDFALRSKSARRAQFQYSAHSYIPCMDLYSFLFQGLTGKPLLLTMADNPVEFIDYINWKPASPEISQPLPEGPGPN